MFLQKNRKTLSFVIILAIISPLNAHSQTVTKSDPLLSQHVKLIRGLYPRTKASDEDLRSFLSENKTNQLSDIEQCAEKSPYFAGLDVKYEPNISVSVKFTQNPKLELEKCTTDRSIKAIEAHYTLSDLQKLQSKIGNTLKNYISAGSYEVSIPRNKIVITTSPNEAYNVIRQLNLQAIPRQTYYIKQSNNINFSHTDTKFSNTKVKAHSNNLTDNNTSSTQNNFFDTFQFSRNNSKNGLSIQGHASCFQKFLLKPDDVITHINDKPVNNPNEDIMPKINEWLSYDTIILTVHRDEELVFVEIAAH